MTTSSTTTHGLRSRILLAVGAGGLFASGVAVGRATAPQGAAGAARSEASAPYVRVKPGSYPAPPPSFNACYAAGTKTAPLPCLERADPQLPMLIGQCQHPATNISEGPATAQYAGSPAVICCYRADMPTCAGRPLRVGEALLLAPLVVGEGAWGGAFTPMSPLGRDGAIAAS